MTPRERHLRIIESWGPFSRRDQSLRYEFDQLIARRGLSALTDEAIRELATALWHGRRRQNRLNASNRRLREQNRAKIVESVRQLVANDPMFKRIS